MPRAKISGLHEVLVRHFISTQPRREGQYGKSRGQGDGATRRSAYSSEPLETQRIKTFHKSPLPNVPSWSCPSEGPVEGGGPPPTAGLRPTGPPTKGRGHGRVLPPSAFSRMTSQTTHSAIHGGDTRGPDTEDPLREAPREAAASPQAERSLSYHCHPGEQGEQKRFHAMSPSLHGAAAAAAGVGAAGKYRLPRLRELPSFFLISGLPSLEARTRIFLQNHPKP